MNIADIKKIIANHNRYASNLMNTNNSTATNTALAYKSFIDSTPLISEFLTEIVEKSKTARNLFGKNNFGNTTITTSDDEQEMMAIYYKHLDVLVSHGNDLSNYAFWMFRAKKFDESIRKLLEVSVAPFIQYVQAKLEEIYLDIQEQDKRDNVPNYVAGDIITNSTVQKDFVGNATMRDVNNDKSTKHFNFQKESFFLGVFSAVISGLLVWGITELIKYIIGA